MIVFELNMLKYKEEIFSVFLAFLSIHTIVNLHHQMVVDPFPFNLIINLFIMTNVAQHEQEKLNRIFEKCWEDENFMQALVENPVNAIEGFFGEELKNKDQYTYEVVDQRDASKVYINVPPNPRIVDLELTDAELEAVAGGWYVNLLWSSVCFGSGEGGPDNADISVSPK
jgi:hypothetical protein